jgi:cellulose synthase/poly-beta-1,6-N-acetylglucosamine synthase-like glycosyltransferase
MWAGDTTGSYAVVVVLWLSGFFIFYFVLLNVTYITFFTLSVINLRKYRHYVKVVDFNSLLKTSLAKPISVLVPAYNEQSNILETVRALLALHYPQFEVIVINDGSTDNTLKILVDEFGLTPRGKVYQRKISTKPVNAIYESPNFPGLIVVDKVNGGKSDALNTGINVSTYPYFCTLDADTLLESDALLKMIRPFVEQPDTMVAVGGIIRVANDCIVDHGQVRQINLPRNWLALVQVVEYLQSFLGSRVALAEMGIVLLISGAFGLYRKTSVIEVGGYRTDTIGEDMELVVRLNKVLYQKGRKYSIWFSPDPVCWTEVPVDLGTLSRQRKRWQKGLVDSLRFNANMIFNARFGKLGLLGMPYYLVFELAGPIIELFGYAMMVVFVVAGVLSWKWTLMFLLLSMGFGTLFSVATILLEELSFDRYPHRRHLFGLLWGGMLYNFPFRQLNAVWRLQATLEYLGGFRKFWGRMRRIGFRTDEAKRGAQA